jgi:hypothetical protein
VAPLTGGRDNGLRDRSTLHSVVEVALARPAEVCRVMPFARGLSLKNSVRWIKPDGTLTTDSTTPGITRNASGANLLEFWTRDSGATVYCQAPVN